MTRRSTETDTAAADSLTITTTGDEWLAVPLDGPAADAPREHAGARDVARPSRGPAVGSVAQRRADPRVPAAGPDQGSAGIVVAPAARTSTAAAVALVLGMGALFSTASVLLAPLGVVFGAGALVLGIVGTGKAGQSHLTGRGLAMGGIVTGVVGMLVGIAVVAGGLTILSDGDDLHVERRLGDVHIEISR